MRLGATCGSSRVIRVRTGVPLGSLGTLGLPFVVVRFILGAGLIGVDEFIRGAPWGSWGSCRDAGFIGVRPFGGRGHPSSLGSLGCAFGFVEFTCCRLINWGASLWSSGSSWVSRFIAVRPGGVSGSTAFFDVRPGSHRVHLQ